MRTQVDTLQFRQIGKGFINNQTEGIIGRTLTKVFVDQYKTTYVKVGGELTPLTKQHSYQAIS